MTEINTHPNQAGQPGHHPHRHGRRCRGRGIRRAAMAGALMLAGAGLGVASTAMSQGYGGPRDGWSDDRPAPGWRGPMHGPMQGGPGGEHRPRFGGMMFGPGTAERMVTRLARVTDASTEQQQKMSAIAVRAGEDLQAMREKHIAGRQQMMALLAAPAIDRAKLEGLRAEQMKLADDASRRVVAAVADIAEVLTPAQRAELARHVGRRFGGGRPG